MSQTWAFDEARRIVEPHIDHERNGHKFVVVGASSLVDAIATALIKAQNDAYSRAADVPLGWVDDVDQHNQESNTAKSIAKDIEALKSK